MVYKWKICCILYYQIIITYATLSLLLLVIILFVSDASFTYSIQTELLFDNIILYNTQYCKKYQELQRKTGKYRLYVNNTRFCTHEIWNSYSCMERKDKYNVSQDLSATDGEGGLPL